MQHFAGPDLESFLICYTCRVKRGSHCRRGSGRTGGGATDWCPNPLWLHAREKEAIQLERRATEGPAKNEQCSGDVRQLTRSGDVSHFLQMRKILLIHYVEQYAVHTFLTVASTRPKHHAQQFTTATKCRGVQEGLPASLPALMPNSRLQGCRQTGQEQPLHARVAKAPTSP